MKHKKEKFVPIHINATAKDMAGNNGIGRYVFLPGSDRRAEEIAEYHFKNYTALDSGRHTVFLGTMELPDAPDLKVAAVSSGMGCPSLDIIVNELLSLGVRRFLRVGTAGSLQPQHIGAGDVVVVTSAVRDENTSRHYAPLEVPAVASPEFVYSAMEVANGLAINQNAMPHWPSPGTILTCCLAGITSQPFNVGFGMAHTKDSLYAREFKRGPMADKNRRYMKLMKDCGAIGSSMEESHLFILASLANWDDKKRGGFQKTPADRRRAVAAGTIWAIVGDDKPFALKSAREAAQQRAIYLAVETMRNLGQKEMAFL